MNSLLNQILEWPAIMQGVIGSAIFWLIQVIVEYIGKYILHRISKYSKSSAKETLIREWIYRKYYSRSGLINIVQGFIITFDHIFQYLIRGLIFIVVAVLLSGISQLALGASLVAALYYLIRSLIWLSPSAEWSRDNLLDHWKRIADIEMVLFGKIDSDTLEFIKANTKQEPERKSKSRNKKTG